MKNKLPFLSYRTSWVDKIPKKISTFFFVLCSLFLQTRAYAQQTHLVPDDGGKKATGNYDLNDFVIVAINISKWVLIVSGSLALLAFVVGGLMFIFSGGNREWVEKGKASLIGAAIGLVIVFLAFTAVNYFMKKIGYDESAFGGVWNNAN